jgi:hypothetical protein
MKIKNEGGKDEDFSIFNKISFKKMVPISYKSNRHHFIKQNLTPKPMQSVSAPQVLQYQAPLHLQLSDKSVV